VLSPQQGLLVVLGIVLGIPVAGLLAWVLIRTLL
jgi:hypothetical protein